MNVSSKLDQFYLKAKGNKWLRYFTVFCRIALALGFLPSGFVKIMGERFTALSSNHPMGHYLEALHTTGYYYTFIGIAQVTAAVLLLIPCTATLGALLYFPIILNICILSLAVRFDGSLISSPLMVLANLYLICWDYDKLRSIFPFYHKTTVEETAKHTVTSKKFPFAFFGAVVVILIALVVILATVFELKPYNTMKECRTQCKDRKSKACLSFCECIHTEGKPLNTCLDRYHQAPEDPVSSTIP